MFAAFCDINSAGLDYLHLDYYSSGCSSHEQYSNKGDLTALSRIRFLLTVAEVKPMAIQCFARL
jgi:hypothetical protein